MTAPASLVAFNLRLQRWSGSQFLMWSNVQKRPTMPYERKMRRRNEQEGRKKSNTHTHTHIHTLANTEHTRGFMIIMCMLYFFSCGGGVLFSVAYNVNKQKKKERKKNASCGCRKPSPSLERAERKKKLRKVTSSSRKKNRTARRSRCVSIYSPTLY